MNRTLAEGPHADFIESIPENTCKDTGSDFFIMHNDFELAGFACRGIFILILYAIGIFVIQIISNWLYTKIGQNERKALKYKAKSDERKFALRSMMFYQIIASLIHIVSVLAIMSSNFLILMVIVFGNLSGLYISFKAAKADCTDEENWNQFMHMLKNANGDSKERGEIIERRIEDLNDILNGKLSKVEIKTGPSMPGLVWLDPHQTSGMRARS